jgi:DTW domain-containing protein
MTEQAATADAADCPRCQKPAALCVCADMTPIENRVSVLILQHPQEQDRALGTARLTALHFRDAVMKVGLSWPSLSKILGRPVDPHRWAIIYLGSARAAELLPGREVVAVDRKGEPEPHQGVILRDIEGVVLLDGNWSQAKALWWRNPWMLKCRRIVLAPQRPSRYGALRREPRRDSLSTIEAAGMLVARLEGRPEIEAALLATFDQLLARYRALHRERPARSIRSGRDARGPKHASSRRPRRHAG